MRAQVAKLGWLMVVDRRTAARVLGNELHAPLAPLVDEATVDAATAGLDLDDRGEFEVDTATAWPVRVSHTRRVANGEASRVDTVEFSRLGG